MYVHIHICVHNYIHIAMYVAMKLAFLIVCGFCNPINLLIMYLHTRDGQLTSFAY